MRGIRLAAGILSVTFVLSGGGCAPDANQPEEQALDQSLSVTLQLDEKVVTQARPVSVIFTITNTASSSRHVLTHETPLAGVEGNIFAVERDGQPVAYTGKLVKRAAPETADYTEVGPGRSLSASVDLSSVYDMSQAGTYGVRYRARQIQVLVKTPAKIALPMDRRVSLASNKVSVWYVGTGPALKPGGGEVEPDAVSGSSSFTKCNSSQQSSLVTARTEASGYSAGAKSYLAAGTAGARYTTWFGIFDTGRYSTVNSHFVAISGAMDTASVKFDCSCKQKKYYAYVYPDRPYNIYLCGYFWIAPMTGTDSKAGTLIHEMSHFNVVAGTDDYVYGQPGAKSLAISDPNKAINNADNHEYFAENTPSQP
jgi:peptidyl-Lys metalloendopeptidase